MGLSRLLTAYISSCLPQQQQQQQLAECIRLNGVRWFVVADAFVVSCWITHIWTTHNNACRTVYIYPSATSATESSVKETHAHLETHRELLQRHITAQYVQASVCLGHRSFLKKKTKRHRHASFCKAHATHIYINIEYVYEWERCKRQRLAGIKRLVAAAAGWWCDGRSLLFPKHLRRTTSISKRPATNPTGFNAKDTQPFIRRTGMMGMGKCILFYMGW